MALFSRLHTWVSNEVLTAADLNGEFNNILNNMVASSVVGASANLASMQTVTDPGAIGSESLAGSVTDELQRVRYMLKFITGKAQWYDHTGRSFGSTSLGITNADMTANSVGTTNLIDGSVTPGKQAARIIGVGTSTGSSAGMTGTTATQIASVAITSTGRPVSVFMQADTSGNPASMSCTTSNSSGNPIYFMAQIFRDSTLIGTIKLGNTPYIGLSFSPSEMTLVDPSPAAGLHTYVMKVYGNVSDTSVSVQYSQLVALEL